MRGQLPGFLSLRPDYGNRVFGLDAFRAIAILLVVLSHGSMILNKADPGFPYLKLPDGVELFFVLSGYLIGGILLRMYNKPEPQRFKELLTFWKRRWFRTLPNYYLVLLINLLLAYLGISGSEPGSFSWKFLFFLQNFASPFTGFFWESWSLSVEEWFYVFTPIALSAAFILYRRSASAKNIFLAVILFFLAAPLIYRIYISAGDVDAFWYENTFKKLVVTRLDAIMYGVLFAWISHYFPNLWSRYSEVAFFGGLILMCLVLIPEKDPNSFYAKTFYFSVTGLSAALLLPFAARPRLSKGVTGKIITHISLISYSMYLINLGLAAQLIDANADLSSPAKVLVWYFIYWIAVAFFSTLLYKYFEKPVMDLRDR